MIQFGTIKYGIQFRASNRDKPKHHRGESSGSGSEEESVRTGGELPAYMQQLDDRGEDVEGDVEGEEPMPSDPEDMVVSGDEDMEPEPGDLDDDDVDGEGEGGKRLEQVRRHRQDAENNNSLEDGEGAAPSPLLPFPFPAASHVTLEALQNTKVAVAQFAATTMANNSDNEAALQELAVLQSTLFTLQHQQVFQLQLIQQLQNQLSLTRHKDDGSLTPPGPRPPHPHPPPGLPTPSPPKSRAPTREPTPVKMEAPIPFPSAQAVPPSLPHPPPIKQEPPTLSIPKPPTPSPPVLSAHPPYSSISSSLASTIITNNDPPPSLNEPNTLEMLQRRAQEVLDNASQGLLANNLADELAFRKSGKMSPYDGKSGGRNEPFFKHRCRYCGKVFGSDSALQIHIRSHTGERPFKCNVCGSRFTTKGNLKVHFQRHTAKFPHVKMNPNPIPEHLDKYHPPLLAQLSPGPLPGMPPHPMPFPPGGSPFPPALPLYRPPPRDLMPPRTLSDKPSPLHPLFALRDEPREQEAPADLSKPAPPSPLDMPLEDRFKSEPSEEDRLRDRSFEERDRVTPKREPDPDRESPEVDRDPDGFPSPSPYDECSMDSKYSSEDMQGRDSPDEKRDPDQPENLSIRGNTTCNICYKTFACNSALEIHYRSHTKERPFKCTVCDRGFSTKGNMKQHMLTHKIREGGEQDSLDPPEPSPKRAPPDTELPLPKRPSNGPPPSVGVPPPPPPPPPPQMMQPAGPPGPPGAPPLSNKHLCGVCRKNFSSSSALQIHMRTHTGDKPFRCSVCQKAFTTKGNLKVHMGTHMWSNGASRRGRRMSLELPPRPLPLSPQDSDFLQRRPDLFYPYLPAPFLNGMQQKLNEISVIQQNAGQNGLSSPGAKFPGLLGFGPFGPPPPPLSQPASPLSDKPPSSLSSPPPEREEEERRRDMEDRRREMEDRRREMEDRPRQVWELHYERAAVNETGDSGPLPLLGPPSRGEGLAA